MGVFVFLRFVVLILFVIFSSCQNRHIEKQVLSGMKASAIRPLSHEEKAADFDQLIQIFKTYYGPYQYKESRFGFSIEQLAMNLKQQAMSSKTDEEFMGYVMQFGAALQDGHVQFRVENSASNVRRYTIPILLMDIEGKAIIGSISKDLSDWTGLKVGDEVLSVDGQTPAEIRLLAQKYKKFATDLSNQALIINTFSRSSFMTDIIPQKPLATVKVLKKNNEIAFFEIPWTQDKYNAVLDSIIRTRPGTLNLSVPFADEYNAIVPDSHLGQMGQVEPVFLTPQALSTYGFVKVYPSSAALMRFGLKGDEKPGIYAALYKFLGKTILLVRSATYSPSDYNGAVYLKAYMALLSEYESLADVLVLDQTHNPGGSYCASFYDIFAKPGDVQGVEKVRADRKWINDLFINWPVTENPAGNIWDTKLLQSWGSVVEKAYDNHEFLSEPFPLFTGSSFATKQAYTWTKPMLVLIDELAGSCGDIFPMLVKANKRAKLFGRQTMGLGGNVEPVGQLNHSRITVSLTRGLFYPYRTDGVVQNSDYIENNGVLPDYEYNHTVSDFRNGYIQYIQMFSQKAIEQLNPSSK